MNNTGFRLYLVFIASWFLHLGTRVPALGLLRIDLLLVCVLFLIVVARKIESKDPRTETHKLLRVLIIYSILAIPFVEWPGSVLNKGISDLIKAIVFYYFTIAFVDTEQRLKTFVLVFVGCQLFRIMEPLYLHITEGYWGTVAYMLQGAETLDRLSGAPSDIVNPNGLAFIICTVLPFLYFLSGTNRVNRLALIIFGPLSIYALMLTGSRSGIIGLIGIFIGILWKSKGRFLIGTAGILIVVLGFPLLSADMQDRYLSIIGKGEKNAETATGRMEGVQSNFEVALRRPLFGHGLGTSREANANFGGEDKPAHNLYAEIAQELGFVGLIIFLLLIKSVFMGFLDCQRSFASSNASLFLLRIADAVQIWLWLNILFSFASYGLTSYEWYLLGGFSVVLQRLAGSGGSVPASVPHESAKAVSTFRDDRSEPIPRMRTGHAI